MSVSPFVNACLYPCVPPPHGPTANLRGQRQRRAPYRRIVAASECLKVSSCFSSDRRQGVALRPEGTRCRYLGRAGGGG